MNLQEGMKLFGFTVNRVRRSAELDGTLIEMTHDRAGTQLCWVDNGVENKLFSISFRTLPEDSTGVFHILEHSVLCGSEKYPVREPFVELLKGSMNTFLNAMTFQDKTMYPVSSRNAQDFLNLTEVYLDAVFASNILHDPNIFYQEGWHIEQNGKKLTYKGVVFNEMKGAMSDPDDLANELMLTLLYPDNAYGVNSGGDPVHIPDLSYEQFRDIYRKCYHPSNARIFLDGDIPLERTLTLIDSYLSRFERAVVPENAPLQQPQTMEKTEYYEIAENEDAADHGRLLMGRIIGSWTEKTRMMAASLLGDVLLESNEAPLKRAILDEDLAQDVTMSVEDSFAQPNMILMLKNVADGREQEALDCVRETVRSLADGGLDHDDLRAAISRLTFRLREPKEPAGLIRCISAHTSWLQEGDPMQYLEFEDALTELNAMLENGGFEQLLRELFLQKEGMCILHLLPSTVLGEEKRKAENARLEKIAASWNPAQWEENAALNASLKKWQQTPETPEQLDTLPKLALSEVSEKPERLDTEIFEEQGVKVLFHKAPCRGIVHVNLFFSLTDYTLEELNDINMISALLGELPTDRYDSLCLQRQLHNLTGAFSVSASAYSKAGETETCKPAMRVYFSTLEEKLEEACELVAEILLHTHINLPERVKEIVLQENDEAKQGAVAAGHHLGILRARASLSAEGAANEALGGYTSMQSLHDFADHFDTHFERFLKLAEAVSTKTFAGKRLLVGITAEKRPSVRALLSALPEGTEIPEKTAYRVELPLREGIRIPAQIGFATQCWNMMRAGYSYSGASQVAANILSLSYYWNRVRVQGGAYGTSLAIDNDATVITASFRDPTPGRSLAVNEEAGAFLRQFCEGEEDLTRFIISTVADKDPLLAPGLSGTREDLRYLRQITPEDVLRTRREILSTTKQQMLELCPLLDRFAAEGNVCVVGHTAALEECRLDAINEL